MPTIEVLPPEYLNLSGNLSFYMAFMFFIAYVGENFRNRRQPHKRNKKTELITSYFTIKQGVFTIFKTS